MTTLDRPTIGRCPRQRRPGGDKYNAAAPEARTKKDPTGGNRGRRHDPKIYKETDLTLAQIDEMGDDEISKHYGRYEARLGASMTKTLGASALQMYALVAGNLPAHSAGEPTHCSWPTLKKTPLWNMR